MENEEMDSRMQKGTGKMSEEILVVASANGPEVWVTENEKQS
jgi:hypothetical protein